MLTVPLSILFWLLPSYVQFTDRVQLEWLGRFRNFPHDHPVWWILVGAVLIFAAERLVGHLVFPALTYLPWAVATRALGFEAVTRNADAALDWTEMIVRRAVNADQRVRVICVGGKHLWCVVPPGVTSITGPPLRLALEKGKIDAVMPRSIQSNPTVSFRYETYRETFKTQANYREAADLVNEMEAGKNTLLSHPGNVLHEHEILCMWRIVLTDEYCLAQNYFPNAGGGPSYRAPAFLFRKGEPDNYYDVFAHMFELIKRSAKRRTTPPPPASEAVPTNAPPSPMPATAIN